MPSTGYEPNQGNNCFKSRTEVECGGGETACYLKYDEATGCHYDGNYPVGTPTWSTEPAGGGGQEGGDEVGGPNLQEGDTCILPDWNLGVYKNNKCVPLPAEGGTTTQGGSGDGGGYGGGGYGGGAETTPPPGMVCTPIDCYDTCRQQDRDRTTACRELNNKHVETMKAIGCKSTSCKTRSLVKSCRRPKKRCVKKPVKKCAKKVVKKCTKKKTVTRRCRK